MPKEIDTNSLAPERKEPGEGLYAGKPVVLMFTGYFSPGYKAGGILRNILNTVDNLCDEFDFRIVTRDRDLGEGSPYADIKTGEWQTVGNAMVYYLPPASETLNYLYKLIRSTEHNILFLNSYFDPLTIKVLINRKIRFERCKPVIVAPFGEFAWASLGQKYLKKYIFILAAKITGLYDNITWRVSSEFEAADVTRILKIGSDSIHITGDLPIKNIPIIPVETLSQTSCSSSGIKIVFLSRIAREKNLDYSLTVLSKVSAKVVFDIYGPTENVSYWNECQELIARLPDNISVNYLGNASPHKVFEIFSRYDLFLFPTGGEAYGNVIAESLTAGTPVVISTETPWRNLQSDGLGWDIDLANMDAFVEVIENYALLDNKQRSEKRAIVKIRILDRLFDPAVLESNRQLFIRQLN